MAENLSQGFNENSLQYAAQAAIQWKKDEKWLTLSYARLRDQIKSVSKYLLHENTVKGDRVGILLENRPEWPVLFFSTLEIGAITVPINPGATHEEVENIVKDSGSKLLFVSTKTADLKTDTKTINVDSPDFEAIVNSDEKSGANFHDGNRVRERRDTACILYTSGTTDKPKGVMLSHGNLLSNCESLNELGIMKRGDRVISILPLHHAYSLTITMLLPLFSGAKIIYPGSLRGDDIMRAMKETNPSIFVAVPQIYYGFHKKIKEGLGKIVFPFNILLNLVTCMLYKLRRSTGMNLTRFLYGGLHGKFGKSIRFFASGGAKLDEGVQRDLFRLGFTILEGYGLTETSPVLTFNPEKKPKIGSVGLPIPRVEIDIINKDKKGSGEVIARGPNIMEGYYKRKDLTDDVIKDGWFHTGDLGYTDNDGYLFLTGRCKDVIVLSSGLNIYPDEIEEVYMKEVPAKEMCVFEVPAKTGMEEARVLWAVIVPDLEFFKKYGEVNLRNVIKERFDNASKTLPAHKRLMGFSITLDPFPRTLLGKIKRFEVHETYKPKIMKEEHEPGEKELSEEDSALLNSGVGKRVIGYLKNQTKVKNEIVPENTLELDLGIDSLGRIELASGLERVFGGKIGDEVVGQAFTVRDLILGLRHCEEGRRSDEAISDLSGQKADPDYWKKTLGEAPGKESLDKIDLNPGILAWLWGYFMTLTIKIYFKLFHRLTVEGAENVPDKGPCIFYANHTSYFDGFLVATSLPRFPRLDLFFVGFRPYFTVPVIRNLVKIGRIIPLDFAAHLLEALRSNFYVLKNGKCLCLFPEGLRTLNGNIVDFKTGFGILTRESGVPLVPIYLKGTFEAWPRTSRLPRRHPIKVIFGKPITALEAEKQGFKLGAKDGYEAVCLGARQTLLTLK